MSVQSEADDSDLPVIQTFSDQKKSRKELDQAIRTSVVQTKKAQKAIRKAKHSERSNKQSSVDVLSTENTEVSDPFVKAMGFDSEFSMPSKFDVANHLPALITEEKKEKRPKNKRMEQLERITFDSDEGYTGSDEHDRSKKPSSDEPISPDLVEPEPQLPRSRAGRKRRPAGLQGAFHVERLDKSTTEQLACMEAEKFWKEALFAPLSRYDYPNVRRVKPETLASLAAKRKVQKCRR